MSAKKTDNQGPDLTALAGLAGWGAGLAEPRGAAARLRQVLRTKVERITSSSPDDMNHKQCDEIAKIASALDKLERAGLDLRLAGCEVIGRLAAFVAASEPDPERRSWLAGVLTGFLNKLEQEV